MEEFLQVLALAFVQGITEFLPISSSGHLILLREELFPDLQGAGMAAALDIALHVGSLCALVYYFRRELVEMLLAILPMRATKATDEAPRRVRAKQAWAVLLGTIPICVVGLLLRSQVEEMRRNPSLIAWALLLFGLLLGFVDRYGKKTRAIEALTWRDICVVGFVQILALIPGASRSGVTMTAGLSLGLDREAAARFSFLLAVPVIALVGVHKIWELLEGSAEVPWLQLLVSLLVSAFVSLVCIHYFLRSLGRIGMLPFVLYRCLLGIAILTVTLT